MYYRMDFLRLKQLHTTRRKSKNYRRKTLYYINLAVTTKRLRSKKPVHV